jgi:hypothetical protein
VSLEATAPDGARRLALRIVQFVFGAWAAQGMILWAETRFHWVQDSLLPGSMFCDAIESALAIRALSAPLLADPRVAAWPYVFKHYLFQNEYVGHTLTIYHVLPFGLLQLMGMDEVILWASPWAALAVLLVLYIAGAFVVQTIADRMRTDGREGHLAWALFLVTYPGIFMLDRGNYASGYANLWVVIYLLTAISGKWRWAGFVALALALNIRPNAGLVALIEFALAASAWRAVRTGLVIGALTIGIAAVSLILAHAIDPKESIQAFMHGYGLYQNLYVFGDWGMFWNASLFGAERIIAAMFGHRPSYNETAAHVVTVFCLIGLLILGWLVWTRRARPAETAFLTCTACVLMTPVFYEYHVLIMIAPVLILCERLRAEGVDMGLGRLWPILAALVCACFVLSRFPSGAAALALFVGAALVPVLVTRLNRGPGRPPSSEAAMLAASVFSLCPLGGMWTNGLAVAGLLLSSAAMVGLECWRRLPAYLPLIAARPEPAAGTAIGV